ncbi:MAG TPA: hypothetical protein VGW77_31810 [Candidatus Binatia bacterium]|jgi:hypothetical protein|nr:hypothetical protein [Candidatus Binatia bacterium]
MLIRRLTPTWPPADTVGTGEAPGLDDIVVGAAKQSGGHITLMLRKPNGSVYGLLLVLPEDLLNKALTAISDQIGITLREVGELDVS